MVDQLFIEQLVDRFANTLTINSAVLGGLGPCLLLAYCGHVKVVPVFIHWLLTDPFQEACRIIRDDLIDAWSRRHASLEELGVSLETLLTHVLDWPCRALGVIHCCRPKSHVLLVSLVIYLLLEPAETSSTVAHVNGLALNHGWYLFVGILSLDDPFWALSLLASELRFVCDLLADLNTALVIACVVLFYDLLDPVEVEQLRIHIRANLTRSI